MNVLSIVIEVGYLMGDEVGKIVIEFYIIMIIDVVFVVRNFC